MVTTDEPWREAYERLFGPGSLEGREVFTWGLEFDGSHMLDVDGATFVYSAKFDSVTSSDDLQELITQAPAEAASQDTTGPTKGSMGGSDQSSGSSHPTIT